MSDLISREAFGNKLSTLYEYYLKTRYLAPDGAVWDCIKLLCDAPTIDTIEVVYGHWIDGTSGCYKICSECDQISDFDFDYCPNCGAKMDGGSE